MSTRRFQARLDRVARSLDIAGGTGQTDEDRLHEFTIDPELAEMLCKDSERSGFAEQQIPGGIDSRGNHRTGCSERACPKFGE